MLAPTGRLAAWKSRTRSSRDWLHNEARCPSCGLHLDAHNDLDEYIRVNSDRRATGANVTYRRCDASLRIMFVDGW
jgi:hypothetical protein